MGRKVVLDGKTVVTREVRSLMIAWERGTWRRGKFRCGRKVRGLTVAYQETR